ncbi:hypothetical protein CONLIGDRAFT_714658 [Coniochaeta ligniaria NRRL 30616]|uniref:Uncharacterized protein n=1 Tax=Coniochaeta ligniaria NRRL 30616 TaxID=1408157 RepID=A0A1J7ISG7_9PEZI|nr:hypothetical protein CONLIGDRAFT_714658 [Coniochaeta ligniaria NRRL 30616]
MVSATTPAARNASLDDVRAFTYKLIPTCMLALLAAYITSTLIYTINLQQPLPKKVALSISFLFLAFLVIFVGGALILHFSYRAARLRSLDTETGSDPAIRADNQVSVRTSPPEVQRDEAGAVAGRGHGARDEHLARPQRYHEQNVGSRNSIHDPRQPSTNVLNDRRYQPYRGSGDSIERSHPRQVDRHHSVTQQIEPQQPVPRQVDTRHPHPLSSTSVIDYGAPDGQARPSMQARKSSVPENPQLIYSPEHDARGTLPSIRVISPTPSPPPSHWPGGSDHTFSQRSESPSSQRQRHISFWNRLSQARGDSLGPHYSPLSPQDNRRPQGPRPLPASTNHNPQIHLSQHPDISHEAQDVLALLLRKVLLAMDNNKTQERHGAVNEKELPPEYMYKPATCEKDDELLLAKVYDGKPPSKEKNKLSEPEPDTNHPLHEKPKTSKPRRQKILDKDTPRPKLRTSDLPGTGGAFVEDIAAPGRHDGDDDGEISPKTKEAEPDWAALLGSNGWKPVDYSAGEGSVVFEGRGNGGAVGGGDQQLAGERRPGPGPVGWRRCEEKEKDRRAGDDWEDEDEADYEGRVGEKE